MIYELNDLTKVRPLFESFEDATLEACLQGLAGKVYVTDPDNPRSAMAHAGSFAFYGGEPDRELVKSKPEGYVIMIPQDGDWAELIESYFPAIKMIRYAIRKEAKFDRKKLEAMVRALPAGYEIWRIDADLYDLCAASPVFGDFVSAFASKENYLENGLGMVVIKDGKIVSGASSYTRYREGIDIEVETLAEERCKGLARAVCAALILRCLDEGLSPRWDAANKMSVRLAEKLGFEFSHEYYCFGVR